MILDVRPILYSPGERLDFRFQMDLSDLEFAGRRPVQRPVDVSGEVRNTAGLLELELTAHSVLDTFCDRCGKPMEWEMSVPFSCMLAESLENGESDEIELLEDGKVDVGELARTAFILGMDTKILCSEDRQDARTCREDDPVPRKREADPRLAVLAKLLEDK